MMTSGSRETCRASFKILASSNHSGFSDALKAALQVQDAMVRLWAARETANTLKDYCDRHYVVVMHGAGWPLVESKSTGGFFLYKLYSLN